MCSSIISSFLNATATRGSWSWYSAEFNTSFSKLAPQNSASIFYLLYCLSSGPSYSFLHGCPRVSLQQAGSGLPGRSHGPPGNGDQTTGGAWLGSGRRTRADFELGKGRSLGRLGKFGPRQPPSGRRFPGLGSRNWPRGPGWRWSSTARLSGDSLARCGQPAGQGLGRRGLGASARGRPTASGRLPAFLGPRSRGGLAWSRLRGMGAVRPPLWLRPQFGDPPSLHPLLDLLTPPASVSASSTRLSLQPRRSLSRNGLPPPPPLCFWLAVFILCKTQMLLPRRWNHSLLSPCFRIYRLSHRGVIVSIQTLLFEDELHGGTFPHPALCLTTTGLSNC